MDGTEENQQSDEKPGEQKTKQLADYFADEISPTAITWEEIQRMRRNFLVRFRRMSQKTQEDRLGQGEQP